MVHALAPARRQLLDAAELLLQRELLLDERLGELARGVAQHLPRQVRLDRGGLLATQELRDPGEVARAVDADRGHRRDAEAREVVAPRERRRDRLLEARALDAVVDLVRIAARDLVLREPGERGLDA